MTKPKPSMEDEIKRIINEYTASEAVALYKLVREVMELTLKFMVPHD